MSVIHFVVEVLVQVISGIVLRVGQLIFKGGRKHKSLSIKCSGRHRRPKLLKTQSVAAAACRGRAPGWTTQRS